MTYTYRPSTNNMALAYRAPPGHACMGHGHGPHGNAYKTYGAQRRMQRWHPRAPRFLPRLKHSYTTSPMRHPRRSRAWALKLACPPKPNPASDSGFAREPSPAPLRPRHRPRHRPSPQPAAAGDFPQPPCPSHLSPSQCVPPLSPPPTPTTACTARAALSAAPASAASVGRPRWGGLSGRRTRPTRGCAAPCRRGDGGAPARGARPA